MNRKMRKGGAILVLFMAWAVLCAGGNQDAESVSPDSQGSGLTGLAAVAAQLGVSEDDLAGALGDPSQGAPDFEEAGEALNVDAVELEELMKQMMEMSEGPGVEVEPYTVSINNIDFTIPFEVFTWDELPSDVAYERSEILIAESGEGTSHYYERIYLPDGNLNWFQAAYLAADAGGYMACPTSEEENAFLFSLVDDVKYFWSFPEEGDHYGISIGPFLGGYQPEGSEEPLGGWSWLSGEAWGYSNWAQNLDDGVIDKDPRDNTQPNDSGDGQPIMGYGELNQPVPTWGDYMDSVGTYGESKLPGRSYAFIIEYEADPR